MEERGRNETKKVMEEGRRGEEKDLEERRERKE